MGEQTGAAIAARHAHAGLPVRTALELVSFHGGTVTAVEQPCTATGRVKSLRLRVPERGNSYTSFELADGTGRVPAMSGGTLDIDSGDLVEVRGVYRAVVHEAPTSSATR
jgi:hypothetical protein